MQDNDLSVDRKIQDDVEGRRYGWGADREATEDVQGHRRIADTEATPLVPVLPGPRAAA